MAALPNAPMSDRIVVSPHAAGPAWRPEDEFLPATTLKTGCSPRWSFTGCALADLACEIAANQFDFDMKSSARRHRSLWSTRSIIAPTRGASKRSAR